MRWSYNNDSFLSLTSLEEHLDMKIISRNNTFCSTRNGYGMQKFVIDMLMILQGYTFLATNFYSNLLAKIMIITFAMSTLVRPSIFRNDKNLGSKLKVLYLVSTKLNNWHLQRQGHLKSCLEWSVENGNEM